MSDNLSITSLLFNRPLNQLREFEKQALADIRDQIDPHGAQFDWSNAASIWLQDPDDNDVRNLCVLFNIVYSGGGGGVNYAVYVAVPNRLYQADDGKYYLAATIALERNAELFVTNGRTEEDAANLRDLVVGYHGYVSQIWNFENRTYRLRYSRY